MTSIKLAEIKAAEAFFARHRERAETFRWIDFVMITGFMLGWMAGLIGGDGILARQGVALRRRWLPLLPGLAGSGIVGYAWWLAIFGP